MSDDLYNNWKKDPSSGNLKSILDSFGGLINSEIGKYQDIMPKPVMRAKAKEYVIGAVRTYDPSKGALSTHVVNNLKRLGRFTSEEGFSIRIPEDIRQSITSYDKTYQILSYDLNREPSIKELAGALQWPEDRVERVKTYQVRKEFPESSLEFAPEFDNTDPMENILAYLYHDSDPTDRFIIESTMGREGKPVLSKTDIAAKLKISIPAVSNRAKRLAEKIKKLLSDT